LRSREIDKRQWKNSLLLAVLKDSELLQMKLNAAGTGVDKVNTFYKISPDGKVYIITSNGGSDKVIEVSGK
jgi:hypothetical protein